MTVHLKINDACDSVNEGCREGLLSAMHRARCVLTPLGDPRKQLPSSSAEVKRVKPGEVRQTAMHADIPENRRRRQFRGYGGRGQGVAKATEPLQDARWWSGPGPLHTHFRASEVRKGTNDQQNPSPAGEFLLGRVTGASFQSKQTHQRILSLLLNLKYLENTEFLGLKLSSFKGY